MVIVKLIGGLGNQLFQYAAARRVAYINNVPLRLDTSRFERYPLRKYSLNHFNIAADMASSDEIALLKGGRNIKGILGRYAERLKPYHKRRVVRERSLNFDPNILKVSGDVYLEGYWGSEKYFKDIETTIREELKIRTEPSAVNTAMAERISQVPAVSMHIRRADFISNPRTHRFHGVCSLDYYNTAVDKIAQMVEKPHFFVFSDDPQWGQENLKLEYPITFVTHNSADQDYEDLRLMSLCRYHITANSTFSWWGAWLSTNKDKIVIAPSKWFTGLRSDPKDLFPEGWIRI